MNSKCMGVLFLMMLGLYSGTHLFAETLGYSGLESSILDLGYSGRDIALAESVVALPKNPYGGLYNPAALAGLDEAYFGSLQGQVFDGVQLFSLHYAFPITDRLSTSIHWMQLQIADIPIVPSENALVTQDIAVSGMAKYLVNAVSAGLGFQVTPQWSWGLSCAGELRALEMVNAGQGFGWQMTLGTQFRWSDQVTLGASLPRILGNSSWKTGHVDTLDRSLQLGAAWAATDQLVLTVESEMRLARSAPIIWSGSMSYSLWDLLVLRAGVQQQALTGGLGIKVGGLRLDYAYTATHPGRYGDTSRLSLAFAWVL